MQLAAVAGNQLPVPSMGFVPLRGPSWSAPLDPSVEDPPAAEAAGSAGPPGSSELPPGPAAESLQVFPARFVLPPKKQPAALGVTRSLSGPVRLRDLAAAPTSMGFLTSKIAPRSASSVGLQDSHPVAARQ